jgi:hypothetical protein
MKLHTVRDHIASELAKVQGQAEDARQMIESRKKKVNTKAAWRLKLEAPSV